MYTSKEVKPWKTMWIKWRHKRWFVNY